MGEGSREKGRVKGSRRPCLWGGRQPEWVLSAHEMTRVTKGAGASGHDEAAPASVPDIGKQNLNTLSRKEQKQKERGEIKSWDQKNPP